jgi:hypothetical protein
MSLSVGDIVAVTLKDCSYYNQQGQVVEIVDDGHPDGRIGVKFGEWCESLAFYESHAVVRFEESELRQDADWSLKVKVFQCYGTYVWHSLYVLPHSFDLTKTCKAEGCQNLNVRRCLINIWGNVYEIDLCETCAQAYHGKIGESFPQKAAEPVAV